MNIANDKLKMKRTVSFLILFYFFNGCVMARNARILKGKDADIVDFPYQASLRYLGRHICGATIISDRHILTAGHCIINVKNVRFLTVHTGVSRSDDVGNLHLIQEINVHPGYAQFPKKDNKDIIQYAINDIAVITLMDKIVFNNYQQKINLPSQAPVDGQIANVTGWGITLNNAKDISLKLQKLETKLITSKKCQSFLTLTVSEDQICAFKSKDVGVCSGDSGGPLASNRELIGVISFGEDDLCATGKPDVYANVHAYLNFIKSAMK